LQRLIECWPGIDADLLLLQEVELGSAHNQPDEVAEALRFPTVVSVEGHADGERREGLTICSRLGLERSYGWPLPTSAPLRRALVAEVTVAGIAVTVVNAHAVFMPAQARQAQIAALLSRSEQPLLVAGDLNATPADLCGILEESDLADPHGGLHGRPTWPMSGPAFADAWARTTGRPPHFRLDPKRIDYVLTRGLRVRSMGTDPLRATDGGHASDHALVWVDFVPGQCASVTDEPENASPRPPER